jgi:hypothetical protein
MKCSAVGNILGNTLRTGAGGNAVGQTPPLLCHITKGHVKIIYSNWIRVRRFDGPTLFVFALDST